VSSAKELTTFSFPDTGTTGSINERRHTIEILVPYETNRSHLIAAFTTTGETVKVGSIPQISGQTANDFNSDLTYTVTAQDYSTQHYIVTVIVASRDAKFFTSFGFPSQDAVGLIDEENDLITVTVPYSAGRGALTASFSSIGQTVTVNGVPQTSGVTVNDFSEPVTYVITAHDGSTRAYTVRVDSAPPDPRAQWTRTVSAGQVYSHFQDVAVDTAGNCYTAGWIMGTDNYAFGPGTNVYTDAHEAAVLVKYNSDGTARWAAASHNGIESRFSAVAVDPSGNIYAAGHITGTDTYIFGDNAWVSGVAEHPVHILVVKYNTEGEALWARSMSVASGSSEYESLAVDAAGNVYAGGYCYGADEYVFDDDVSLSAGGPQKNMLLVKYDTTGDVLWARSVTSGGSISMLHGLAVDAEGNVYAAGSVYDHAEYSFGNDVSVWGSDHYDNALLIKYDPNGTPLWATTPTEGALSTFNCVAVDNAGGAVYAGGQIYGTDTYTFGPDVSATGILPDLTSHLVLVRYDTAGNAAWAETILGGDASSQLSSIAVGGDGSVYGGGGIIGTATYLFHSGVTVAGICQYSNCLLLKYSPHGSVQWARSMMAGTNFTDILGIALHSSGKIYGTGNMLDKGTYSFDPGVSLTGPGPSCNAMIVQYFEE